MNKSFIYGVDLGSLQSIEQKGATFKNERQENEDILAILKRSGVQSIRLRLFVDPTSKEGKPYGGGDNTLDSTLNFAKRAQKAGFLLILDFHYSDFWADPGKQFIPKGWPTTLEALKAKVFSYTKDVLLVFKNAGIFFTHIQVGNEITNGMLWPVGRLYTDKTLVKDGFRHLSVLLNSAILAVRDVFIDTKVIIHLDRGGDKELYEHFFTNLLPLLEPIDVIGLSYYPYWHGSLTDLAENISNLQAKFPYEIMIMETSYAYTGKEEGHPFVVTDSKTPVQDGFPPYTPAGQKSYLKTLFKLAFDLKIAGLFYWEPAWIYVEGDTWATKEGRAYTNESEKSDGNEWANQALFNELGEALPALFAYNEFKEENNV